LDENLVGFADVLELRLQQRARFADEAKDARDEPADVKAFGEIRGGEARQAERSPPARQLGFEPVEKSPAKLRSQ